MSTGSATQTKPATPTRAQARGTAEESPSKIRIKMNTSMSGYHQVPKFDSNGKPIFSSETGKRLTERGDGFVLLPDREYEWDSVEAERLIDAGYAEQVVGKAA